MQKTLLLVVCVVLIVIIPLLSQGQDSALPECTESELALLNDTIVPKYNDLMSTGLTIETTEDLLAYIKAQINWRDNSLSQLPNCSEAIELGLLMAQSSSDVSTFHALSFAGVQSVDNPIESRMIDDIVRFGELLPDTTEPTTTEVSVVTTYYVISDGSVNIRSCGSTDCGVVATANRGEALTVVDDSGDWYELQLSKGVTGYIAKFLVSVNSPSTRPTALPVQPTANPQNNTQPTVIPAQPTAVPIQPTEVPVSTVAVQSEAPAAPAFTCDCSKTCPNMASCDEAYFQLNTCGCGRRDGDGDGVPCESICPGG